MNFVKATKTTTPKRPASPTHATKSDGANTAADLRVGLAPPPSVFKPVTYDRDWGKFEKHTKGFGSKYLEKFNFKGRLGKREQGIARPISVITRRPGAGLGAVKEMTNLKENKEILEDIFGSSAKPDVNEEDSEPFENAEFEVPLWQRAYGGLGGMGSTASTAPAKKKRKYAIPLPEHQKSSQLRTTEVIAEGSNVQQSATKRERPFGAEVMYNVNLLFEMAESSVIQLQRKQRAAKTNESALKASMASTMLWLKEEEERLERLNDAKALFEDCFTLTDAAETTETDAVETMRIDAAETMEWLDKLENNFGLLRQRHREAFFAYRMTRSVPGIVKPHLRQLAGKWDVFGQPAMIVGPLQRVRALFGKDALPESKKNRLNLFDRIVDEVILPVVQIAFVRDWDPKEHTEKGVELIALLQTCISSYHLNCLLEYHVVPKIQFRLETDSGDSGVPPHVWIHPWLPLLKEKVLLLQEMLRPALRAQLKCMPGCGDDVLNVVQPWTTIFSSNFLDQILEKSIIPKLLDLMEDSKFTLASTECTFEALGTMMAWHKVMDPHIVMGLLEGEFFPRCFRGLYTVLQTPPDFAKLLAWYERLKKRFPMDDIVSDNLRSSIKKRLNGLLEMINAVLTDPLSLSKYPLPPLSSYEAVMSETGGVTAVPKRRPTHSKLVYPTSSAPIGFKKMLEMLAQKNDLAFVPRSQEHTVVGKQVYTFGSANIYLDQKVVFLQSTIGEDTTWRPVSLDELVLRASAKSRVATKSTSVSELDGLD
eukprot:Stramenopile-MAST_4_protein_3124